MKEIAMLQSLSHKKKDWIITLRFSEWEKNSTNSFPSLIIVSKLNLYTSA